MFVRLPNGITADLPWPLPDEIEIDGHFHKVESTKACLAKGTNSKYVIIEVQLNDYPRRENGKGKADKAGGSVQRGRHRTTRKPAKKRP